MLDISTHGGVAEIALNRPNVRNALDAATIAEFACALDALDTDTSIGAVVLYGHGSGFCAGSDLKEMETLTTAAAADRERRTGLAVASLTSRRYPIVAAVHGFAIGGGFCLAATCDVVVSSPDAMWRLPEVSLGWPPPWGLGAVIDRVGVVHAQRLTLDPNPTSANDARRLGLVDQVADDPRAAARKIGHRLAGLPRWSVAATRSIFADYRRTAMTAIEAAAIGHFASHLEQSRSKPG